jgi:hypothetical protein
MVELGVIFQHSAAFCWSRAGPVSAPCPS